MGLESSLSEHLVVQLAGIIAIGVTAQWVAWRVNLPSILLLLTCGLVAGPVTGWLSPDTIFGDVLTPVVSMSVALILYEGGLTLKLSEVVRVGAVVRNLVTVGAFVTWSVGTLAAHIIFGLAGPLAALLGAVLVVTGPTVIAPLLRHVRPSGDVGPILKWEGIVIDPIGALLAVLIFESILIGDAGDAGSHALRAIFMTVFVGGGLGLLAAGVLTAVLYRHWIADHLENALSLMLVLVTFVLANHFQHESGLLAVTVMGFALANQKWARVDDIVEFKENLQVLLISSLFIVLGARVEMHELLRVAPSGLLYTTVLLLIARPLSVLVSTLRSPLTLREKLFLAWMAPRGIVAAAVVSVFALRLADSGHPDASVLVPIAFVVIIATVAIYGLTSAMVARRLGLAEADPQGLLIVGASVWTRQLAGVLAGLDIRVVLVDSNREHISAARMSGFATFTGSILADHTVDRLDLGGVGRILAVTPNDWVNTLAVHRFERIFGKAQCYQLAPQADAKRKERHRYLHGQWLFDDQIGYEDLERRVRDGYAVKATRLSDTFDWSAFLERYRETAIPLFIHDSKGKLRPLTAGHPATFKAGETVISLVIDKG